MDRNEDDRIELADAPTESGRCLKITRWVFWLASFLITLLALIDNIVPSKQIFRFYTIDSLLLIPFFVTVIFNTLLLWLTRTKRKLIPILTIFCVGTDLESLLTVVRHFNWVNLLIFLYEFTYLVQLEAFKIKKAPTFYYCYPETDVDEAKCKTKGAFSIISVCVVYIIMVANTVLIWKWTKDLSQSDQTKYGRVKSLEQTDRTTESMSSVYIKEFHLRQLTDYCSKHGLVIDRMKAIIPKQELDVIQFAVMNTKMIN